MNFIILTLLFLYSCNSKSGATKNPDDIFPDKRPSDFVIIYNENGGMLDISESIFISKDSCYYEKNKYRNIVRVDFMLSDIELDSIYNAVVENKFNEIETYSKKVYDRGGTSVSVTFGNNQFRVSNSGVNFIEKDWSKEYSNVSGFVNNMAQKYWDKKSRDFVITIENSVKDKTGYIMFDNFKIFDGEDPHFDNNGEIINTLKLVDGVYSMNYSYNNEYSLKPIDIKNKNGLRIFSRNGKLDWK